MNEFSSFMSVKPKLFIAIIKLMLKAIGSRERKFTARNRLPNLIPTHLLKLPFITEQSHTIEMEGDSAEVYAVEFLFEFQMNWNDV